MASAWDWASNPVGTGWRAYQKYKADEESPVDETEKSALSKRYADYDAATAANEKAALGGIDAQLAAAKGEADWARTNVDATKQRNNDIALAARRHLAAGIAGAGSRYGAGSGAQAAQMTQAGSDVASSEADMRQKASLALQDAAQRALQAESGYAQAQSSAAAERQKMAESALARGEAQTALGGEADQIVSDIAGYWASDADMQKAANEIERTVLPKATTPAARAEIQRRIDQLRAGNYQVHGAAQASDFNPLG